MTSQSLARSYLARARVRLKALAVLRDEGAVREIRVHTALEHRVLYVAKFAEAVYVLHAFEKRSRKTDRHDVELGRQGFRALMRRRRAESREER